jgi:DNA-binding response OmpR family regulator
MAVYILVADDEPDLVWALRHCLGGEGYEVATALDGAEALVLARRRRPDLVILDVIMPRLDGFQVCQELRSDPYLAAVPILFLTAKDAVEDRLQGLDSGGDDYLPKPFDVRELKSRVRALLRRSRPSLEIQSHTLALGPLALDVDARRVRVDGKPVLLTPTQFKLLYHLMSHAGRVFSERELLQQVWGYPLEAADLSLVRWHIKKLREKIEPNPAHPIYIRTVPRHGYALMVPTAKATP